MNPEYALLIQMALGLAQTLTSTLTKANAPAEVLAAVNAAVAALRQHWNDPVTKQALENLRG
jgi:hypothetical protein